MNYPKNRYTGEKPWMNQDWLYEQYITLDRSSEEIASEYGCKPNTIQCWLCKFKIKKKTIKHKRTSKHVYETYEFLYDQYVDKGKTITEIAREVGVSADTITYHLKKYNLWVRKKSENYTKEDEDLMIKMYCDDKMSANQIAIQFKTSHRIIIDHLRSRGIQTRTMREAQFNYNKKDIPQELFDSDWLYNKHWIENVSCKAIGDMFNIDARVVRNCMHNLGIPTKTNSESKLGLMTGENHPNWQGGLTPLKALLREFFYVNLASKAAERDNYTCQLCGATHTVLHVHHIKHFSEIVNEIRDEHPELNVDNLEDRLKLYDIIVNDSRFLDLDNLKTYCKECHLFKIHGYTKRNITQDN